MNRKMILAAAFTFLFVGFVRADLLVKPGEKVAFMGDSITEKGWTMPGGYVKLTVAGLEMLGAKVVPIPAGVGGNTSRDMLARLNNDVLSKKPDWLTLSCGVNDVWHGGGGCTLEEFQKNITSIVDQAQAAGIKVVIMTATVIGEDDNDNNKKLVAYNDWLHQLAAQRHLPIAEENAAFQDALKKSAGLPPPFLTQDGVHPMGDGSVMMARTLLTAFGASPAQVDQAQAAWMDMPDSAFTFTLFAVDIHQGMTLKEYTALKAIAASRKIGVRQLLDNVLMEALDERIQAHRNDPAINGLQVKAETQDLVGKKLAEMAK